MNDFNSTGMNQMTCKEIFKQRGQIEWDRETLDYNHGSVVKILRPNMNDIYIGECGYCNQKGHYIRQGRGIYLDAYGSRYDGIWQND